MTIMTRSLAVAALLPRGGCLSLFMARTIPNKGTWAGEIVPIELRDADGRAHLVNGLRIDRSIEVPQPNRGTVPVLLDEQDRVLDLGEIGSRKFQAFGTLGWFSPKTPDGSTELYAPGRPSAAVSALRVADTLTIRADEGVTTTVPSNHR